MPTEAEVALKAPCVVDTPAGAQPDPSAQPRLSIVTQYIKDRLEDTMDTDKVINLMLAIQLPDFRDADGSTFFSKETAEVCDRPFLHFE